MCTEQYIIILYKTTTDNDLQLKENNRLMDEDHKKSSTTLI